MHLGLSYFHFSIKKLKESRYNWKIFRNISAILLLLFGKSSSASAGDREALATLQCCQMMSLNETETPIFVFLSVLCFQGHNILILFLFALQHTTPLLKMGLLCTQRICSPLVQSVSF